tara:strand:- start:1130 stop:1891 length:762 start_codon:yes stop_codon:yes gene_type:complete
MNKTFTTAKGIAHYPYISAPDTKFDEQGHYKVNLCLSKDDASPVLDIIKQEVLEGIKALKKDKPNLDIKQAPLPFSDEVDEEGNPTGNIIIKFKSKAAYKPAIFDSKGTPMMKSNIYAGSVIKVNGSCAFFHTQMIGAGVSLRLRAVQVIQYVEGASGATKFGFEEESGFTVEEDVPESVAVEAPVQTTEQSLGNPYVPETPTPAKPAVVQAIKPVQQVKPKPVEEPKAQTTVSGADDLAAEISKLVGNVADD